MKAAIATISALTTTPALAHPGHFAESSGHSHWLAAGTLALAAVIAGAALWRSRKRRVATKRQAERKA